MKFVYGVTLEMGWSEEDFPPRQPVPCKAPTVLSPQEVETFLKAVPEVKNRTVLTVCYGAGLRISEAVALKIANVDSACMVLQVDGKRGQTRQVPNPVGFLAFLGEC